MLIKKSNFLFFNTLVLIFLVFTQCKKDEPKPDPVALFSAEKTGVAFSSISFSNLSTDATSYLWDFGDGETSAEKSPVHTYEKAGKYTVILTATGNGKSSIATQSITISAIDVKADFYMSGNFGNAPIEISFSNYSRNAETYQWSFGDGGSSTEESPNHTYLKGGTYTVKLTVTAKDGTSVSSSQSITISKTPELAVANFSFTGANNYAPSKITFSNSSTNATSYVWDFGDGKISTEKNPTHVYTSGGTYNVTLKAYNSEYKETIISKSVVVKNAPTKLRVTNMKLIKIPFINDKNASWDLSNGPDVYFTFSSTDQTTNFFKSETTVDISPSMLPGNLGTAFGLPYTFLSISYQYTIVFYDKDTPDADDWIGGSYFTIKDYMPTDGTAYPSTISFGTSSDKIQFQLEVEWLP